jgi:uncharacterized protein YkwD
MFTFPTITKAGRVLAGTTVSGLLLTMATATASATVSASATTAAGGQDWGAAAQFVSQINAARASAGRPRLSVSSALTSAAASWAATMARTGRLAHNPNLAGAVSGWKYLGENVGVGDTVASLESAFYGSSGHRSNMLDPDFTLVGVAVVHGGGRLWVAEEFIRPLGASAAHARPTSGRDPHPAARPRAPVATPAAKPSAQQLATLRQLNRAFAARHQGWAPSLSADALPYWTREVTAP